MKSSWWQQRFPYLCRLQHYLTHYQVPSNLNFWYVFGSIALCVLVMQAATGIALLFHYEPTVTGAFQSVENIMQQVPWGWLLRYIHTTGASAFFIVIYLHLLRSLLYGSYRAPRELVWLFGMALYGCIMMEAFFGYLLPWGQMSYWGAQVITHLFGAIPDVGDTLLRWVRGGDVLGQATLSRFYVLHIIVVPLMIVFFVVLHLLSLHAVGANNPEGFEVDNTSADKKTAKDIPVIQTVPFHPYFTVRDGVAIAVFLLLFFAVVFYAPAMQGYFIERNNTLPANPAVTPEHMAPMWYFSLFYAMLKWVTDDLMSWLMLVWCVFMLGVLLRMYQAKEFILWRAALGAVVLFAMAFGEAKWWGMILMLLSVWIWTGLPWLDHSAVRSLRYRPVWHRYMVYIFAADCVWLGYSGLHDISGWQVVLAKAGVLFYFIFFLGMPWWSRWGKCREKSVQVRD